MGVRAAREAQLRALRLREEGGGGGVCGCWGSVMTPASGSPLSSGAGGPWLIEMQGTGWQAAAAAYRQNPAEKGRRDGGGG